jgi:hypothetical protein
VAGGAFTQSPGYEKLLQSDYFVNLTSEGDVRVRAERARHAVVGLEHTMAPGVVARVEAYYKSFSNLVIGRLETQAEADARTAMYDFPGSFASHIPREAQILSAPVNQGRGRASGVEFYVARQSVSSADRALTGWVSYTRSRAEKTIYDLTMPADYDRPHAFSLVANLRLSPTVEVATTVRVQSGFPYSPPVGVRVAAVKDLLDADRDGNRDELIPHFARVVRCTAGECLEQPYWTFDPGGVSNLNSARLPAFSRVDARVTFRPGWMGRRWHFYVDVINLLNADNASGFDAALESKQLASPAVTGHPLQVLVLHSRSLRALRLRTADCRATHCGNGDADSESERQRISLRMPPGDASSPTHKTTKRINGRRSLSARRWRVRTAPFALSPRPTPS